MTLRNHQLLWLTFASFAFVGGLILVFDAIDSAVSQLEKYSPPPPPKPPVHSDSWPKEFGQIFKVRISSYKFEVPEKYFYYSQKKEDPKRIKNTLSFAFWYPDLHPAIQHKAYYYDRRPAKPGRPVLSSDESIVSAGRISEILDPMRPYPPEEELTRMVTNWGGENGRYVKQDQTMHGLDFYKDKFGREELYFKDDNLVQRKIECHIYYKNINKNCNSIVFIKKLNLRIGISFVADQIPIWRKIENATIELLRKFMTNQAPINSETKSG